MTLKIRKQCFQHAASTHRSGSSNSCQTSSYSASERQRVSNTLRSPDSLTDIWPQNSQLKHFKLSSVAEPRRQSDPEGGRPCSLLGCLLTLMWVQVLIWWSERLFLLSLPLWLFVSHSNSVWLTRASVFKSIAFLQNFTRPEAIHSTNTQTKTFG